MVFFTCNSCGESLKKAQVDKHKGMCRGCACLSCIDCGKDFWGEDYKNHVRCISEDQKYGGKDYEIKANKGDVKQQQWIQRIHEAMNKPGINPKLKEVLNQISSYDNVPRKKAKFQNWMKSSLRIYDARLQDQVWEIFSAPDSNTSGTQHTEPKPEPPQPPQIQEQQEEEKPTEKKKNKRERKEERQKKKHTKNNTNHENGESAVDEGQTKKKKRKRAAEERTEEGQNEEDKSTNKPKRKKAEEPEENQSLVEEEDQQEEQDQSNSKGKFNWKGTIKAVLRQAPDEGLSIKKLRKKVLAAYYSFSGDGNYRSEEEVFTVFNKKLNNPKFRILKDKVRLVK
ncbi:hypothetical protein NFI96_025099 [Prochilodus magdalenae]|nr:hypothetical protein NFI96_025099 [Prochilodus magdalenae]